MIVGPTRDHQYFHSNYISSFIFLLSYSSSSPLTNLQIRLFTLGFSGKRIVESRRWCRPSALACVEPPIVDFVFQPALLLENDSPSWPRTFEVAKSCRSPPFAALCCISSFVARRLSTFGA